MESTQECPYCGHEMINDDYIDGFTFEVSIYVCTNCGRRT